MSDRPMIPLDNCDGVRSVLPRFLDGESGPLEETRIAQHLSSCPGCREVHDHCRDELLMTIEALTDVSSADVAALSRATRHQIAIESSRGSDTARRLADGQDSPPVSPPAGRWWSSAAALLVGWVLLTGIPTSITVPQLDTPAVASMTLIRGDVDANGRLDWADFQELISWLRESGPEPRCLAAGDLDDDGTITIEDSVLALARLAAGTGLEVTLLYPRGSAGALPCLDVCP